MSQPDAGTFSGICIADAGRYPKHADRHAGAQRQTHRPPAKALRLARSLSARHAAWWALATTTVGAVVQPGTVIVTLVPQDEPLMAEVSIENKDIGFVAVNQTVRVKLLAYEFQKYGMLEGAVRTVGADSAAQQDPAVGAARNRAGAAPEPVFKALIGLRSQRLEASGLQLPLAAGMQVSAEIVQGKRTELEYLLSPVQRVVDEAGSER